MMSGIYLVCTVSVISVAGLSHDKTLVTVLNAQMFQSYLSCDLAIVIEVVEGESPLLPIIFFN